MITPVMLHEDAAFYEYFKPYHHPGACHESSACCLLNQNKRGQLNFAFLYAK